MANQEPETGTVIRLFEFVDDSSSKFWEVTLNGSEFTVRFGKIGTNGQSKTKNAGSPEKAKSEMEKLIREKTGKGYKEVGGATPSVAPVGGNQTKAKKSSPSGNKGGVEEIIPAGAKNPLTLGSLKKIKSGYEIKGSDFDAITDAAAASLGKYYAVHLDLNGLTSLSDAAAASLGRFKGDGQLYLNGLTALSDAAAASLGKFKGDSLSFYFLKSLSDAAAKSLYAYKGKLFISK